MESKKVLVCLTIMVIITAAQMNKKKKAKKVPSSYFITNWEDYKIPQEIEIDKLKTILEHIAAFKRLEYCPFGKPKKCQEKSIVSVVRQIVQDVLQNKPPATYNDSSEENVTKKNDKPNRAIQVSLATEANINSDSTNQNNGAVETGTNESKKHEEHIDDKGKINGPADAHVDVTVDQAASETGNEPVKEDGEQNDHTNGDDGSEPSPPGEGDNETGGNEPHSEAEPAEAEEAALRARDKPNQYSHLDSPKAYVRTDDIILNVRKLVNLGNNLQIKDKKDLRKAIYPKIELVAEDDKYMVKMLNLFQKIMNVKKDKERSILPQSELDLKDLEF